MTNEDRRRIAAIGLLKSAAEAAGLLANQEAVEEAAEALNHWTPEGRDAPFFSETYLYELLGKDDARALLGRFDDLLKAAGVKSVRVKKERADQDVLVAIGRLKEAIEAEDDSGFWRAEERLARAIEMRWREGF